MGGHYEYNKNRYPSWWGYYYLIRNTYFIFGIPFYCYVL